MKREQAKIFWVSVVVFVVAVAAVFVWLDYSDKRPHISYSDWVAVKPATAQNDKYRVAIASMISAEETWITYKDLIEYIAGQIGQKTSMILRPSYSEVRILLEEKKVDLALVCTGTYIVCSRTATVELIVAPVFKDDMKYTCLFVVGRNSQINDIADLRDRTFAFTDHESNTGCIVPSWAVAKQGYKPETYFSKIIYTGSHDRSLHAVAKGVVDGAGVDSLVFHSFVKTHPEMKDYLRVIWESEAFGAPPVVVPTGLPESTKERLRAIFLSMPQDVRGREILDGIGIERFKTPQPDEYSSARKIWGSMHGRE